MPKLPVLLTTAALFSLAQAAGSAQAQTLMDPENLIGVEDDQLIVEPYGITVDELEEMDIVGASGEVIGGVDDVLAGTDGTPVAVVVEVGGFLGIGDHEAILALDDLKMSAEGLMTELTEEQIEALPEYED